MEKVAAIDVGSNAIRLLGVSVDSWGTLVESHFERYALRLGTDVFERGRLGAAAISRLESICKLIVQEMKELNIKQYRAVATSAMRDAENGDQVVDYIFGATGLKLEIISGIEESAIAKRALLRSVGGADPETILLDLGGGSLELDRPDGSSPISLPFGTVRLLSDYPVFQEPMSPAALLEVRGKLRERLYSALGRLPNAKVAIGTGGNLTVLSRHVALSKPGVPCIDLAKLRMLPAHLAPLTIQERMTQFGLRADRADLALAATIMVDLLVDYFGVEVLMVPGSGLREELLYTSLGEGTSQWLEACMTGAGGDQITSGELRRRIRVARSIYSALWPIHRRYPAAERLLVLALLEAWSEPTDSETLLKQLNCLPSPGKVSMKSEQRRAVFGAAVLLSEYEKGNWNFQASDLWLEACSGMSQNEISAVELLGGILEVVSETVHRGECEDIRLDMQSEPFVLGLFREDAQGLAHLEQRISAVMGCEIVFD